MPDRAEDHGTEVVPGVVVSKGRIGPGTRDRQPNTWLELALFVPEVGRLLWRVARDPRVPRMAKVVAGVAVAYVMSPVDLIPDFLPGAGQLDDLFIVLRALRYLAANAGYDVLREHWSGSDDGFALLLVMAGVKH